MELHVYLAPGLTGHWASSLDMMYQFNSMNCSICNRYCEKHSPALDSTLHPLAWEVGMLTKLKPVGAFSVRYWHSATGIRKRGQPTAQKITVSL